VDFPFLSFDFLTPARATIFPFARLQRLRATILALLHRSVFGSPFSGQGLLKSRKKCSQSESSGRLHR